MLGRVGDILEMIKFSHTLFALPFALFGAVEYSIPSSPSSPILE